MNIYRSIDIEDEIRKALTDYLTVYVRPLPDGFTLPCILVTQTGGTSDNLIDSFNVTLDSRAETDEQAFELIRTAQGLLESQTESQFGELRSFTTNTLARWGTDPVRPDIKLCTLTCTVRAHKQIVDLDES